MFEMIRCRTRFSRIVSFLLAVHLFNFSVDTMDAEPFTPEDLSVNEIESIAEFLVEEVFGFTGFFAEHDEKDNADNCVDSLKLYFTGVKGTETVNVFFSATAQTYVVTNTSGYALLAREISTPPPEA